MATGSGSRRVRGGLAVAAVAALAVPATVLVTAAPAAANAPCGMQGGAGSWAGPTTRTRCLSNSLLPGNGSPDHCGF